MHGLAQVGELDRAPMRIRSTAQTPQSPRDPTDRIENPARRLDVRELHARIMRRAQPAARNHAAPTRASITLQYSKLNHKFRIDAAASRCRIAIAVSTMSLSAAYQSESHSASPTADALSELLLER